MRIGVDAGGTFTDFVLFREDGRLETFKLRSNPANPASVILEGLRRAGGDRRVDVVHGSTVATNALLERKGVRTALVSTEGFEDVLEIGRQNRAELYNLTPQPRPLLIPRELCFGAPERAHFDGKIARRPTAAELGKLTAKIRRSGARAIAICLLHSYRNPVNERAVKKILKETLTREGIYVCASHEISPEFREYERASTTAVNAYVGPLMDAYLGELEEAKAFRIAIMQSNGGFLAAKDARKLAVRTVLSGPAGGAIGAMGAAKISGFKRALGFDMGGTSTDVCLIDGAPRETTESIVDGLPIRVPMLDIHTVGAGGGSIARVDAGGLLRVGPESAGADPGPACYGQGTEATVTDAHVVLGRVETLLGGAMALDTARSATAIDRLARKLKMSREQTAAGILRVANANMERAIRVVSVERGYDPRDFALVAFGGGGGLHACEIAEELGMLTVIVPQQAGALSALGMLMADAVRDYSSGVLGRTDIHEAFEKLEQRARKEARAAHFERSADLRYRGQSYELNIAWPAGKAFAKFHAEHKRVYGYARPDREVEVVTIRVRARAITAKPKLQREPRATPAKALRRVWTGKAWRNLAVLSRGEIGANTTRGPALILDYGSTTLIPAGWRFHVDRAGNLIAQR